MPLGVSTFGGQALNHGFCVVLFSPKRDIDPTATLKQASNAMTYGSKFRNPPRRSSLLLVVLPS